MGVTKQKFAGIETNIPGAYTKSNYLQSPGALGAVSNAVLVIGSANGGIPYNATGKSDAEKINKFSSTGELQDMLRGGPGYYMSEFYMIPTKNENLNKPSEVYFIRVDPAIPGSATLQDALLNDIIDITTTRYGSLANQLSRKIEAATTLGHKVTVKFQGNTIIQRDNVGFEYMEIQYTGAAVTSTMNITATQLDTTCAAVPADDLVLLFADFEKLGDLVAYINEQPNYTCTLKADADTDTTTFDAVTAQDIKTLPYVCVAHVEALIQFLTNETLGELTASLHAGAVRTDVTNDANFIFMSSGTNGVVTNTQWAGALELAAKFNFNHILPASGDASVHAMVVNHCTEYSNIENKKNRSCGLGALSSIANNDATMIGEMIALNSSRSEYHITEFDRPDVYNQGQNATFAPFYGAALTAGIRFANHITTSPTFKDVYVTKVSRIYSRTEKKDLIQAGATMFEQQERGFVVVHNVSTYQGTNLLLNVPAGLRTCDFITLDLQVKIEARLARMVQAPTAIVIADMVNWLSSSVLPGYKEAGYLTDDPNSGDPAFSDISFQLIGDRFNFGFRGIVPVMIHYAFITQDFAVVGLRNAA